MTTLEAARIKLNTIDKEMIELFEKMMLSKHQKSNDLTTLEMLIAQLKQKRLMIIKDVAIYKQSVGLPIYDPQREQELIKRNCELLKDKSYISDYLIFIHEILDESKAYQKQVITSLCHDER